MPHLATALLSGAVLSLLPITAVQACPEDMMTLRLSVTQGPVEPAAGTMTSSYRAVLLTCDPLGGGHPKPEQACAQLKASDGRIEHNREPGICTKEYSPRTVEATGHWQGKIVKFSKTYGNKCEMTSATGILFDF